MGSTPVVVEPAWQMVKGQVVVRMAWVQNRAEEVEGGIGTLGKAAKGGAGGKGALC